MFIDAEREYLTPPDNEPRVLLHCYFCGEDIYENDDYYEIGGVNCCELCLDKHFKLTAKPIDYAAEKADLYIHDIKDL